VTADELADLIAAVRDARPALLATSDTATLPAELRDSLPRSGKSF
jgi:hypothetical protein